MSFQLLSPIGTPYKGIFGRKQLLNPTPFVHPFLHRLLQILPPITDLLRIATARQLKTNTLTILRISEQTKGDKGSFLIWEKHIRPSVEGSYKRVYYVYLIEIGGELEIRYQAMAIQKKQKIDQQDWSSKTRAKTAEINRFMMQEIEAIQFLREKQSSLLLPKSLAYWKFSRKKRTVFQKELLYVCWADGDLRGWYGKNVDLSISRGLSSNHDFGIRAKHMEGALADLMYIHQRNRVHGDIKPENILKMPDGSTDSWTKLCDFAGLCTPGSNRKIFTPCYLSPTVRRTSQRLSHIGDDLYALGLTFILLCNPYLEEHIAQISGEQSITDILDYFKTEQIDSGSLYPICKEMLIIGDQRGDHTQILDREKNLLAQVHDLIRQGY